MVAITVVAIMAGGIMAGGIMVVITTAPMAMGMECPLEEIMAASVAPIVG